jgi:pimeloyl-ACP methyl ester carboxylesterase
VFLASVIVIAIHVIDDNFLQPEPGTSAADHLRSGLLTLAVLAAVTGGYVWLPAGLRAVCALLVGAFGLACASEAFYYTREVGASGDDFSGWLCIPAGLLLLGLGVVILWRSRKRHGKWYIRYGRRLALGVAAVLATFFVVYPILTAYTITHVITATVPEPNLGADHEEVRFTTRDGLTLDGWYVPSRNDAAVIVFPGRDGKQGYARMLAAHGYGVLLFDRRGEGASDGDPNLLGWGGARDILAAVEFLRSRHDVDPDRIGGIGLSVGGELMMEAAAESGDGLQAIVTDGAGARSVSETLERPDAPWGDVAFFAVFTAATWGFSNEPVPPNLESIVDDISPTAVFFLYGENGQPQEIDLTQRYYESARQPKQIWAVPGASHIDGINSQPDAYEQRVVAFFDENLLADG